MLPPNPIVTRHAERLKCDFHLHVRNVDTSLKKILKWRHLHVRNVRFEKWVEPNDVTKKGWSQMTSLNSRLSKENFLGDQ